MVVPLGVRIPITVENIKRVRCFKCGQKDHITPNCKNKVDVLSDKEEEYSPKFFD